MKWRALLGIRLAAITSTLFSAGPFSTPAEITLGDVTLDGDFCFEIPLGVWKSDKGFELKLTLKHRTRVMDYGIYSSAFELIPACSTLTTEEATATWLAPGGLTLKLPRRTLTASSLSENTKEYFKKKGGQRPPDRFYRAGEVEVVATEDRTVQVARMSNWLSYYQCGKLREVVTPAGETLFFESLGQFITRMGAGREEVFRVEYDIDRRVTAVTLSGQCFTCLYDSTGNLISVAKKGAIIADLKYSPTRMLASVRLPANGMSRDVHWRAVKKRRRIFDPRILPVAVSVVGNSIYDYDPSPGTIALRMTDTTGEVLLTCELQDGRIRKIRQTRVEP